MEEVTIKKMPLSAIVFNRDSAKLFIEKMKEKEELSEFQKEMLTEARWKYLEWNDCIRIMEEYGKDYIYLKEAGGCLKYEIGDLLFPL